MRRVTTFIEAPLEDPPVGPVSIEPPEPNVQGAREAVDLIKQRVSLRNGLAFWDTTDGEALWSILNEAAALGEHELSAACWCKPTVEHIAAQRVSVTAAKPDTTAADGSRSRTADSGARYVDHYAGERRQTWTTPRILFDPLNDEFGFDLDGAASADNALLPDWSEYALTWTGRRVFCNPPWSQIPPFIELAATAEVAVLLVPARTNARWFHRALALGAEVRYFLGKPRFGEAEWNSPVDCVFLVFRGDPEE
jgi:hypothetical protein